jgi:L,D-transpeptidase catalytic domain
MERLRFLAAQLLAVGLACAATKPAIANIIIHISKPTQTMTVTLDGQVQYRWRVSTGATGYSTPVGSYTAFRMEVHEGKGRTYSLDACRL